MDPSPSPIALLVCPLCVEQSGRRVAILAEYDLSTPVVTVADLFGCAHAEVFGQVGGLTLDEERRLIQAALDMWETSQRDEDEGGDGIPSDSRGCA